MTDKNINNSFEIIPPEKPFKMKVQPIVPPRMHSILRHIFHSTKEKRNSKPWYDANYARLVHRRRMLLTGLVAGTVFFGLLKWAIAMPSDISPATMILILLLFALTFGWIALYFWSGVFGFAQLINQAKALGITYPQNIADELSPQKQAERLNTRTAILMPVYNEEPSQTSARLLAIAEDLRKNGGNGRFDIFVLSDTTDPKIWIKEEKIWSETKKIMESNTFGDVLSTEKIHIYYRRRAQNTARKSGNIEDFCNRWGSEYDLMLILDADSLMTAETIIKMARLMESNPHAGIIQASPQMINAISMFARMQQFAGRIAGPVVSAGLAWWQAGNSNYWGHNAIIRTRAFMECCGLPKLKGKGPFGGFILSHDFVEAALIARGGWSTWLLPELKGSYEECPPSVIDFATRDRRWCQGNLQHIKILICRGLHPVSRIHFITGIMSYLSSPLWLLFLLAGLSMALFREFIPPQYFSTSYSLFPDWPVFDKYGTIGLFILSMAMLLMPKFLGLWIYVRENGKNAAADAGKSLLLEIIVSTLLAPVMMMFQSKFVFDILRGKSTNWNTQNRDDTGTDWKTAWHIHKTHTLLGLATAVTVWFYAPALFWWLSPVTFGLITSVPLSVLTSRASIGQILRRHGWFVTSEEQNEPEVIRRAKHWIAVLTPFEQEKGGLSLLLKDKNLLLLHMKMLPINGPMPDFPPETIISAKEKLHRGAITELNHNEEMYALYTETANFI